MKTMLFVSRHAPTEDQLKLARERGYELIHTGDLDAFAPESIELLLERVKFHQAEAVACVHPALAMMALALPRSKDGASSLTVGVFENELRPAEGGKPTFKAKALHLWAGSALSGTWSGDVAIHRL